MLYTVLWEQPSRNPTCSLKSLKQTAYTPPRVEDGLKGQLLPGSQIIPDIAVRLLTLQTAMEMSEEGARE